MPDPLPPLPSPSEPTSPEFDDVLSPQYERGGERFSFRLDATHGSARAGTMQTAWGEVTTPRFMPVGTRGPVKYLTIEQVRQTGARIVLANTYHLVVHPGVEVVESLGGLHEMTGWKHGPILTDSGGFQVFSLAHARSIDDEGVTFKSPRDGRTIRFTPGETVDWQRRLGSDFLMQLDECAPYPCERSEAERAMERSKRWAEPALATPVGTHQVALPIVQGSAYPDLRRESARSLASLNARAYAVGGMSVGEGHHLMNDMLEVTLPELPTDRPRYLMGVGKPADILAAVERGIDMFDCVLPSRNARHAMAYTSAGTLRLKNKIHERDRGPLDPDCPCDTCATYSRGYLRHLFMVEDPTINALITVHNLTFFQRLLAGAREMILQGRSVWDCLPPGMDPPARD